MKVAIVVESMFGHTEALGDAVADGLRDEGAEVTVHRLDGAGEPFARVPPDGDLLVLAAPTHALSLSRPESRADAVTQGADPSRGTAGLREWLAALDDVPEGPGGPGERRVVVLDTRATIARHLPGSAARSAARILRRKGFTVVRTTSFYVAGVRGPLVAGELERARSWGRLVARDDFPARADREGGA